MKAADIDLDAELANESFTTEKNGEAISTWLFRYAHFCDVPAEQSLIISNPNLLKRDILSHMIPKTFFSDDLIAKYLFKAKSEFDAKPHQRKAILNMFCNALMHHEVEGIFSKCSSSYPKTHKVLKVNNYFNYYQINTIKCLIITYF